LVGFLLLSIVKRSTTSHGLPIMVIKSPFPSIEIPESNILTYLFPENEEPFDEPLWLDSRNVQHSLTPKALLQWVKRLSFGLEKLGHQRGDVVMIFTPNHIFVPVAYLGIVGAGCIFSGANPAYTIPGRSCPMPC
jgi:4-coumarate--CoA ligase